MLSTVIGVNSRGGVEGTVVETGLPDEKGNWLSLGDKLVLRVSQLRRYGVFTAVQIGQRNHLLGGG